MARASTAEHEGSTRSAARDEAAQRWDEGRLPQWVPRGLPYLPVGARFWISVVVALGWAAIATMLALPWIEDLAQSLTTPVAVALIVGIAIVPGYLNAQLLLALLFDRPRPLNAVPLNYPSVTLMIAAYNEQDVIEDTVVHALAQQYEGALDVIVINDGSEDSTAEIVERIAQQDSRVRLMSANHGGKAPALNVGLAKASGRLVATLDADTLLMPQSLQRAVARLMLSPPDTVAVAGAVMVRNSRTNMMTGMQQWDYMLGIASVKRQQGLVRGTLVAQGAFSVFDANMLRIAGGWPDMIGEDIVLTWSMLEGGGRIAYEPTAVAFTNVPTKLGAFVRQRRRWARGMIEGLREHGSSLIAKHRMYSYAVGVNWTFPYLDAVFTFAWLPGLVLALTGNFAIVGPMTLAVLPINALMSWSMYLRQRAAMGEVGLKSRHNLSGLLAYFFFYQLIMSPVSVTGYVQEMVGTKRRW